MANRRHDSDTTEIHVTSCEAKGGNDDCGLEQNASIFHVAGITTADTSAGIVVYKIFCDFTSVVMYIF